VKHGGRATEMFKPKIHKYQRNNGKKKVESGRQTPTFNTIQEAKKKASASVLASPKRSFLPATLNQAGDE